MLLFKVSACGSPGSNHPATHPSVISRNYLKQLVDYAYVNRYRDVFAYIYIYIYIHVYVCIHDVSSILSAIADCRGLSRQDVPEHHEPSLREQGTGWQGAQNIPGAHWQDSCNVDTSLSCQCGKGGESSSCSSRLGSGSSSRGLSPT